MKINNKNMSKEIIISSLNKDSESIKKINDSGLEYWEARELMPLLGYKNWRDFENSIKRASVACEKSNQEITYHFVGAPKMIKIAKNTAKEAERKIDDHFRRAVKMVQIGLNTVRNIKDWKLELRSDEPSKKLAELCRKI